jgi:hypothetical protein
MNEHELPKLCQERVWNLEKLQSERAVFHEIGYPTIQLPRAAPHAVTPCVLPHLPVRLNRTCMRGLWGENRTMACQEDHNDAQSSALVLRVPCDSEAYARITFTYLRKLVALLSQLNQPISQETGMGGCSPISPVRWRTRVACADNLARGTTEGLGDFPPRLPHMRTRVQSSSHARFLNDANPSHPRAGYTSPASITRISRSFRTNPYQN